MLSEMGVQSRVVVNAAPYFSLYRNNVGVAKFEDRYGKMQVVRYGLANDSERVNEKTKSGDLIGFRSIVITPEMVGKTVAVFVSRECKHEGWKWSGNPRELAQANWARIVNEAGGDACFVSHPDHFWNPAFDRTLYG